MLIGSLNGFPAFLMFLSAGPRPEDVTSALIDGPLRTMQATSCGIYVLRDGHLRALHMRGVPPDLRDRYAVIDCSLDVPITRALRAEVPVIVRAESMTSQEALRRDSPVWDEYLEAGTRGLIAHMAVPGRDRARGVLVIASGEPFDWNDEHTWMIRGLAASVGMWLDAFPGIEPMRLPQAHVLALTARQRDVLRLVERGATNNAIADKLGFSASTVKQDLQHAMSVLGTKRRSDAPARARELGLLT